MKKLFIGCLLLLCFSVFVFADVRQPEQELTEISFSIKQKLIDLKVQSSNMTLLCEMLQSSLEASQSELSQWKEQSTMLSNSLMSINEQLNNSYETITKYEAKLKFRLKLIAIFITILIVRTIGMVIGYILYAKGIKLPRWLDILL